MPRVYNFSSGPAVLPHSVLKKAAAKMDDYENSGMSVMEMSHRGKIFIEIIERAEDMLRKLLSVPPNYKVLFLQGGASTQFAMVPLNLLTNTKRADFVHTGVWSKKAIEECGRYGKVSIVASSEDRGFNYIPTLDPSRFDPEADFFHVTHNNTVYGTRLNLIPDTKGVPLVSDMSSSILSETFDVSRFGLIYAGAQKNIGPAGVTVVIIREDLLEKEVEWGGFSVPTMLKYKTHAASGSLYNTPPTYVVYIAMLVFEWLLELGGVSEMEKINTEKARMLYEFLDNSRLFTPYVQAPYRSLMNVTYSLPTEEQNARFVKEAEAAGLVNLKGYRTVGGMRASIYNAMPVDGVEALIQFMKDFEQKEGHNV